ncbi:MAG TPA: rod shape-determining protein MreC [Candidatus Tyrphobacter sp.]|nr:rod shape-determining protein MreC [Candidatus Tyrphobacter sp.]
MKREWLILLGSVIFLILALGGFFILPQKFVLADYFGKLAESFNPQAGLETQVRELKQENENLKAALLNQELASSSTVKVYSSYPFNNEKFISLAAGKNQRVGVGDTVTLGSDVLVGKVVEVSSDESVVRTVFDSDWQTAVRIGKSQTDGLFQGGLELKVSLIPKAAKISAGDLVLSAGADLPYGMEIGRIVSIVADSGDPYESAVLVSPFKLEDLTDVSLRSH